MSESSSRSRSREHHVYVKGRIYKDSKGQTYVLHRRPVRQNKKRKENKWDKYIKHYYERYKRAHPDKNHIQIIRRLGVLHRDNARRSEAISPTGIHSNIAHPKRDKRYMRRNTESLFQPFEFRSQDHGVDHKTSSERARQSGHRKHTTSFLGSVGKYNNRKPYNHIHRPGRIKTPTSRASSNDRGIRRKSGEFGSSYPPAKRSPVKMKRVGPIPKHVSQRNPSSKGPGKLRSLTSRGQHTKQSVSEELVEIRMGTDDLGDDERIEAAEYEHNRNLFGSSTTKKRNKTPVLKKKKTRSISPLIQYNSGSSHHSSGSRHYSAESIITQKVPINPIRVTSNKALVTETGFDQEVPAGQGLNDFLDEIAGERRPPWLDREEDLPLPRKKTSTDPKIRAARKRAAEKKALPVKAPLAPVDRFVSRVAPDLLPIYEPAVPETEDEMLDAFFGPGGGNESFKERISTDSKIRAERKRKAAEKETAAKKRAAAKKAVVITEQVMEEETNEEIPNARKSERGRIPKRDKYTPESTKSKKSKKKKKTSKKEKVLEKEVIERIAVVRKSQRGKIPKTGKYTPDSTQSKKSGKKKKISKKSKSKKE